MSKDRIIFTAALLALAGWSVFCAFNLIVVPS